MRAFLSKTGSIMQRRVAGVSAPFGRLARASRGAILLEVVAASLALTLVGTAVLQGLSTAYRSGAQTERQSVAENLGRNQMEYVFTLPYQDPPATYSTISTPPEYGVETVAEELVLGDPNIAKLTTRVFRDGKQVLTLETLRAK